MTTYPEMICAWLDNFSKKVGHAVAWLIPAMMIVMFSVSVSRYSLNFSNIAIQEIVTYFHATVVTLCAAYTLSANSHMRVDIFYHRFSVRTRAIIDTLGSLLFLIPVCVVLLITSSGYALRSWSILEGSPEAGGLPLVFILKTLIPLMALLLLAQGIAEMIRQIMRLLYPDKAGGDNLGDNPGDNPNNGHTAAE